MRYFIISFFLHILIVISISSSIAGNSQQNYEVYFQSSSNQNIAKTSPNTHRTASTAKLTKPKSEGLLPNTLNSVEQNTDHNDSSQGVISLTGQAGPTQSIFGYLISQIYQNRIYPHESIRLKQQGQVTVRFYINENGEITDIQVANPSDYKLLNQAAVKTLDRIKINKNLPEIERLYNRSYSFTFDFEITKSAS